MAIMKNDISCLKIIFLYWTDLSSSLLTFFILQQNHVDRMSYFYSYWWDTENGFMLSLLNFSVITKHYCANDTVWSPKLSNWNRYIFKIILLYLSRNNIILLAPNGEGRLSWYIQCTVNSNLDLNTIDK